MDGELPALLRSRSQGRAAATHRSESAGEKAAPTAGRVRPEPPAMTHTLQFTTKICGGHVLERSRIYRVDVTAAWRHPAGCA